MIVQIEAAVARAPAVARSWQGIDDEGRHVKPLQPRAQSKPFARANHQAPRLLGMAEFCGPLSRSSIQLFVRVRPDG